MRSLWRRFRLWRAARREASAERWVGTHGDDRSDDPPPVRPEDAPPPTIAA